MFTLIIVLLSPCVMLLTARVFSSRSAKSAALCLFEWTVDALSLCALTLLLCTPMGRVTVGPWEGNLLGFSYGRTAAVFSLLSGFLLGLLQGRKGLIWVLQRGSIAPVSRSLHEKVARALLHLLGLLLLLLTGGYIWGVRNYPGATVQVIVFHLNMPLTGTTQSFFLNFSAYVIVPALLLFALYELAAFLPLRHGALRLTLSRRLYVSLRPLRVCLPLALLLMGGLFSLLLAGYNKYLDLQGFVEMYTRTSELIEQEYVDPALTKITFPQQKRNLINIYVESGETTFQDAENGGLMSVNYMPEMTRIARENLSFSQSSLLQGATVAPDTGWTIAGLVAQTAGLPLKGVHNSGDRLPSFLPGATTLGDILHDEGYRLVFMAGSDFTFGGRRKYFTEHGGYEIRDLLDAYERGLLPEDYYEFWGFEDAKLYPYAKEMLTQLSAADQPFHLCLLTVDTHTPGYECALCPQDVEDPYLRTVACASRQLGDFIDWCEQQSFWDETTIVITGDHASMAYIPYLDDTLQYNKYAGSTDRLVYNAFIHAVPKPAQATDRLFTTLDFFPTTLSAIGAHIEGERLGLGVNLFSDEPTLAEKYGYETFLDELAFRSPFYDEQLLTVKRGD